MCGIAIIIEIEANEIELKVQVETLTFAGSLLWQGFQDSPMTKESSFQQMMLGITAYPMQTIEVEPLSPTMHKIYTK